MSRFCKKGGGDKIMRYKVGDKVKIRKDLDIDRLYGRNRKYFVTKSMHNLCGEIAHIIAIDKCNNDLYFIDLDDGEYGWVTDMFEDTHISKNKSEKANDTLNSLKNKLNRMSVLCEMAESTKNIYIFVQLLKNCIYILFNTLKLLIKFVFSRSE